jgi:hypothetical protein
MMVTSLALVPPRHPQNDVIPLRECCNLDADWHAGAVQTSWY